MEVRHHDANGLETTSPKNDQEEQEQVEELIAQGSSTLSLLPCDVSLKCLDKIDVLDNNLLCKIDLNHVEPILYLKHEFVNSRVTHVNKIDFEKPACDDSFVIGDLWHQELEYLNTKSIFSSYVDPFLRNPSIDKYVISILDSNLKDEMTSLHTKMSKPSLIRNFKFHKHVDENVDDFRTWYLLCFHCKMVRPFNGIGMFYGCFVKDFSTHMSFVGYVVIKVIVMHCSHVCAHVLKLLEQLRGTYFYKFLMLIDIMFYKIHVVLYKVHMSCVEHTLHAMHNDFWSHSSHNNDHFFKVLEQLSKHHVDKLDSTFGIIPCKLQENNLKIEVSFVLIAKFVFECDSGSWFVDCDCENHLLVCEISFGFQSEINLLYCTMIFDLDSLDFVGVLDRDLRTNPSKEGEDDVNPSVPKKNRRTGFEDKSFHKEGEDDVNPGIHNHKIQRCRGPWVDWGPKRGWRHVKVLKASWGEGTEATPVQTFLMESFAPHCATFV
ncbi:uncharacterized protein LOC121770702 isoform X1 [Salvia splendens]|uniref:uncharacterized protein LOC121770702 isoform X1 n=1 Tax=Salvia splendens TaxID=180675 RepID=UPI001C25A9CF|nr:uncharacterized protein LOC121770702 isoform X1 [Salvia splendens]